MAGEDGIVQCSHPLAVSHLDIGCSGELWVVSTEDSEREREAERERGTKRDRERDEGESVCVCDKVGEKE